ncbi:ATPase [Halobacteriales archaeon QS_1_67_19]|nr:MAG: ATPase [Halobacteriales archaeon QS_1_67_19]
MARVLGRRDENASPDAPAGRLGAYRARDGSDGAPVHIDLDGPHAALVVGKRGYGKSYTLGVLAEELARASGVSPVVVDPMGIFSSLAALGTEVVEPTVSASALAPRAWCDLLGLAPDSAAGALVWQAARATETLSGMREFVGAADTKADRSTRRAADNHLALAESWGVFDPAGLTAPDLLGPAGTVVDLAGLEPEPANAVVRAVADGLYGHCVAERPERLPWLLVDEAHAFFDGVAGPALRTLLTRGRQPGASFVAATQRPSALPAVAVSQADLLLAHRLTASSDLDALAAARPTYFADSFADRLPEAPGEVLLADDATESVHTVRVRERETAHGGASPSATGR